MIFSRLLLSSPITIRTASSRSFQTVITKAAFSTSIRNMATEFKLKDLTSIDLKNGQKQEAEVEGIEGGKVLLVKVKDELHAMNANCTHYGAPLVKGVVTGDGRLTCPWHGGMLPPPSFSSHSCAYADDA